MHAHILSGRIGIFLYNKSGTDLSNLVVKVTNTEGLTVRQQDPAARVTGGDEVGMHYDENQDDYDVSYVWWWWIMVEIYGDASLLTLTLMSASMYVYIHM